MSQFYLHPFSDRAAFNLFCWMGLAKTDLREMEGFAQNVRSYQPSHPHGGRDESKPVGSIKKEPVVAFRCRRVTRAGSKLTKSSNLSTYARIVDRPVNALDRQSLDNLYREVGSLAFGSVVLLKMVLLQILQGHRSPAKG